LAYFSDYGLICKGLDGYMKIKVSKFNSNKPSKNKKKKTMCLIKHQDMKVYCRVEVELHIFLVMALGVGEWLASRQGSFIPEVRSAGTQ
jgi:hypothetical protein